MGLFDFLKRGKKIAIFVDGPNVIRKDVNVDLDEVKKKVSKYGRIVKAYVFLDQYASDKLIYAMKMHGFTPVFSKGDVDIVMSIYAMESVFDNGIDIVSLMTRDTDYRPLIVKAKERGKETLIVATKPGLSVALKNTADNVIMI